MASSQPCSLDRGLSIWSQRHFVALSQFCWGEERTIEPLVFLLDAALPGLCRGKKAAQSQSITPCLSFPSGSTQSPCAPPALLPSSLWTHSNEWLHLHPHHPITTLLQETQALQGGAQPNLSISPTAAAAGGQLAPVPPGNQPGWALPTLQPHCHQAAPGHARVHHYQCW